jgi:hypothetical protein
MMDPDEQAFQIVFAALFVLGPFKMKVLDPNLLTSDKVIQIEPQRRHVCREFLLRFLERHENARFVVLRGSTDKELHGKEGLPAARAPAYKRRPAFRQPPARDFVESLNARGRFGKKATSELVFLFLHDILPLSKISLLQPALEF